MMRPEDGARIAVRPTRLRSGALVALRLLEMCPLLPIDVFVHLVGLNSCSSAYQQLARLRRAGLAEVERVDLGYLLGERRIGLWNITDMGRRVLRTASVLEFARTLGTNGSPPDHPYDRGERRAFRRETNVPLLVAAYRLLALIVVERATDAAPVDVRTWERPWVREYWSARQSKTLRVIFPAGAVLVARELSSDNMGVDSQPMRLLLVPDLGTAPVVSYREALRRLVALRALGSDERGKEPDPELVIAAPDPDNLGTRSAAWLELLHRVARRQEEPEPLARVLSWERVADVVGRRRVPGLVADSVHRAMSQAGTAELVQPARGPQGGREQALHLIGRHPFLTLQQLAGLLGTSSARISQLERELVEIGWLRRITLDELPVDALGLGPDEISGLSLVETTVAGRRQLSTWLGLEPTTATRHHGLIGDGRGQVGRRRRLLRTLAHTLGVNAVFVAFASAADAATRQGGVDQLAEWRGAAACERRRCKPDSYGCYLRNGVSYGFFLEYDRGTEPGRKYAAKFRAYYWYRDSGEAARDYAGFPTLLFVTTEPSAEQRIAEGAYRAWFIRGTEPLFVLITTTTQIAGDREGILGRIWRTPAPIGAAHGGERQYWLPGGPPRGVFGARRMSVSTPRLAWPTTSRARSSNLRSLAGPSGTGLLVGEASQVNPADALAATVAELRQPAGSCRGSVSDREYRVPVSGEAGGTI